MKRSLRTLTLWMALFGWVLGIDSEEVSKYIRIFSKIKNKVL